MQKICFEFLSHGRGPHRGVKKFSSVHAYLLAYYCKILHASMLTYVIQPWNSDRLTCIQCMLSESMLPCMTPGQRGPPKYPIPGGGGGGACSRLRFTFQFLDFLKPFQNDFRLREPGLAFCC